MSDYRNTTTDPAYRPTLIEPARGSNTMWFIIGAVVIAIAIIAYAMTGGNNPTPRDGAATTGDTNVTVQPAPATDPAPATEPAATMEATPTTDPAPATEPAATMEATPTTEPAPVTEPAPLTEPAPATGTAPAPAAP